MKRLFYGSRFYAYLLKGRHPHGLETVSSDPWPGEADTADALFQGRYGFQGWETVSPGLVPWIRDDRPLAWHAELHGFTWVRHFTARGGDAAQRHVRAMVNDWAGTFTDWHPLAWRADILGRRIVSWVSHGQYLIHHAELTYRSRVLDSLARQARHLSRAAAGAPAGQPRITAALGLVYAGLGLPDGRRRLSHGLNRLESELANQILGDGGHVSRNPGIQMAILRDLIAVRAALASAGRDVPVGLQNAIDRMAPMLRFYRHGDGALALFGGGGETSEGAVDLTLARSGSAGKPLDSAPHSGFERMTCRKAVVLFDAGYPIVRSATDAGSAGSLAFEFSIGRRRMVAGAGRCLGPDRDGLDDGACSALTVDGAVAITPDVLRRQPADRPIVTCTRNEGDDGIWLDAEHGGYVSRYGLRHCRRLYLNAGGDDLRGEDRLEPAGNKRSKDVPFAIVFYLAPGVQAVPVQGGGALLRLEDGSGWRVRVGGGEMSVEDGHYCGKGWPERASKLVLRGRTAGKETVIKWAFRRDEQADETPEPVEGTLL